MQLTHPDYAALVDPLSALRKREGREDGAKRLRGNITSICHRYDTLQSRRYSMTGFIKI
jgi:hypothetical protein